MKSINLIIVLLFFLTSCSGSHTGTQDLEPIQENSNNNEETDKTDDSSNTGNSNGDSLNNDNSDDEEYLKLNKAVRKYFDSVSNSDIKSALEAFDSNVSVNIAGMKFNGLNQVSSFLLRDVIGGVYTVEKVFEESEWQLVYCLFQPKGWSSPEPPIEYRFKINSDKIIQWEGKYR
ncbi:MAG: hypothetical protein N4A49_13885 [Marinifilaceae bacterium]|jgi:hypothetical protein|nr:hypothetical protein [Marinifilaceae bacterium]